MSGRFLRAISLTLILTATLSGVLCTQSQAGEPENQSGKSGGRIEIGGYLGFADFPDEASLYHFAAGAAVRFKIVGGLGFAPEFTYMYHSRQDRDLSFLPNLTWEFRRGKKVVPYVIGGLGFLQHRQTWDHFKWSSTTKFAEGGLGVKVFLNERIFVAPEMRIGWEPHIRATATIGYVLIR